MQRPIAIAALAILLAAPVALADQRNPSVAALPGVVSDRVQAAPVSTVEATGLSRGEALQRLEREGFKTVTRLVRDSEGNWIGAARRGSRVVDIAVDQDGDVIAW